MPIQVATVNTPELVVLGLSSAMAASGYRVVTPEDPLSWARSHPGQAMMVGVQVETDLALLNDLAAFPALTLVALVDAVSLERLIACLEAGASGCASMEWSGGRVALTLDAGLAGLALLPVAMVRDLAGREARRTLPHQLTSSQKTWLQRLASGMTIHQLSIQVGFSERETYRRLRQIYRTMGVRGRTEALVLASASGLLDDRSD